MTRSDEPLAPARRNRAAPATAAPRIAYEDAEVARGQAAAVLGALGRLQLRLDVMGRELSESLSRVQSQLDDLDLRLTAALTDEPASAVPAASFVQPMSSAISSPARETEPGTSIAHGSS